MGTQPDPNTMRAPAIMQAFANQQMNAANQERARAARLDEMQLAPQYAAQQRRMQHQVDRDFERDPMTLARQKTQGILAREGMRQEGQNVRRYGTIGATGNQIVQYALSKGLNAGQAAALAAHMQRESSFNMNAVGDKNLVSRDGPRGNAKYGFGFRLDRQAGIEQWAAQNGKDVRDPKTSIDYLVDVEMRGREARTGGADFFEATTPEQASEALTRVIRHSTTGKHAGEGSARAKLAREYAFNVTRDPNFRNDRRTTTSASPVLDQGQKEGVDPDGKKFRREYLPRDQAGMLGGQGYTVVPDIDAPQNQRGQFPYKLYAPGITPSINSPKPAAASTTAPAATTPAQPKKPNPAATGEWSAATNNDLPPSLVLPDDEDDEDEDE